MTGPDRTPDHVVERYLDHLGRLDFEGLGAWVGDDVVRVGPWGDTVTGRQAYVDFLAGIVPSLPGYELVVHRVAAAGERLALAEITERVVLEGQTIDTPEALVCEVEGGLIRRITIYIQQLGQEPPAGARPGDLEP